MFDPNDHYQKRISQINNQIARNNHELGIVDRCIGAHLYRSPEDNRIAGYYIQVGFDIKQRTASLRRESGELKRDKQMGDILREHLNRNSLR